MKIYIASYFHTRARLLPIRAALQQMLSYTVTSRWLDEPLDEPLVVATCTEDFLLTCAKRDLEDIQDSDLLILDTIDEDKRGGREVEYGVSLQRPMLRYVVGPARNVFHRLADKRFDNWEEAIRWLSCGTTLNEEGQR